MKKKTIIVVLATILTIVIFFVSTYMQKKLINYEPKVECLFLKTDIKANEKLTKDMFIKDDIEISKVSTIKIVKDYLRN